MTSWAVLRAPPAPEPPFPILLLRSLSKLHTASQVLSKHPTSTALLKYGTTPVKYFLQPASPAFPLSKESLRTRTNTV